MGLTGGGAIFTQGIASLLGSQALIGTPQVQAGSSGPYRPTQWSKTPQVMVTTQPSGPQSSSSIAQTSGSSASANLSFNGGSSATMYVFDAVIRSEHYLALRKTMHPVQGATSVSDHAYILPANVVLEVGMSDAMDRYSSSMWTNAATKSISAFEILKGFRDSRTFVTLTTRLHTYANMLVSEVRVPDSYKTAAGLRAIVTFSEIFLAGSGSAQSNNSSRPQTTNSTSQGATGTTAPNTAMTAQHQVSDSNSSLPAQVASISGTQPVPDGAGTWDSNNVNAVVSLYFPPQ